MKTTTIAMAAILTIASGSAQARAARGNTAYDGAWNLSFATQSGPCDPTYDFDVNILNGVIIHPNLVKFHGTVSPNGSARASVTVQDKTATGSGRLSATAGRGLWRGHSGSAACAGTWTALKN